MDEKIFEARTIFYKLPAVRVTKMIDEVHAIGSRINMVRFMYKVITREEIEEEYFTNAYEDIDLIIVDEIDQLKMQN